MAAMSGQQRLDRHLKRGAFDECWEWSGHRDKNGYGQLTVGDRVWAAHRLAWSLARGPIPSGLCVLHRCDNPPCCNVEHLFLGTHQDNMDDMAAKGRCRPGRRSGRDEADREAIRRRRARGESRAALAKEYGVHPGTITNICSGFGCYARPTVFRKAS